MPGFEKAPEEPIRVNSNFIFCDPISFLSLELEKYCEVGSEGNGVSSWNL